MTAPLALAIDQSTSATKAVVYDAAGRMLRRYARDHRQIHPAPGRVEHDGVEIWRNTLEVMREACDAYGAGVGFVSISNQRETFIVFDRATGEPLHHAVVWQCRRGDAVCAELTARGFNALVAEKTGLRIDSYFSAPKIAALLRERPDLRTKLEDGSAAVATIDAWLVHRLTGGRVFATGPANACRTLLYDIRKLEWDAELCGIFGVPMDALPEVRDETARFGECRLPGHPADGLPIAGVMGDSQAALFAHRCFRPGQAKVTLGTGSSILLTLGGRLPASGIRTVGWTHRDEPNYALEGIISYSAATIAWLRDQLGLIQSAGETEAAARAVDDNGGVYLVPAFAGLSAPWWSPEARAAIVGLDGGANRNHVLRAALESIAYQIRDALDSMRAEAGGLELGVIHADGGATRNGFLTQFIADILGAEIEVSDIPDCSPLGAALAGMVAMGVHASLEDLEILPVSGERFVPQMPRDEAGRLHAGWLRAVRQVIAGTE